MLVINLYSLLPAFTVASFLLVLLWPENIAYRNRLRLFMALLVVWIGASVMGMAGYGTALEDRTICFINLIVGCFGLIAVGVTYRISPTRRSLQDPPR